jgi:hypothetical protein
MSNGKPISATVEALLAIVLFNFRGTISGVPTKDSRLMRKAKTDGLPEASLHWIVVGQGEGEMFEAWAPDAVQAVKSVYAAAGGGPVMFDILPASADRSDAVSVYPGDGLPLIDRSHKSTFEDIEKARNILLKQAAPTLRLRVIVEAPLVTVSLSIPAMEVFLDGYWAGDSVRRDRKEAALKRLQGMVEKYRGGVFIDPMSPLDGSGQMLNVHACGLPIFMIVKLVASLREAATEALSTNLRRIGDASPA